MERMPMEIHEKPPTNIREIPLREVMIQHRVRYVLHLSIGDMVFRHIGRLERDDVHAKLIAEHPDYEPLREEFAALYERAQYDNGMTADEMLHFQELDRMILPYSYRYSLPCIVSPTVSTVDELDALLSIMKPSESNVVLDLLGLLNSPREVMLSPEGVMLIQELKLPLPPDLTIETITAEQVSAFREGAAEVGKDVLAQLKGVMKSG